MNILTRRDLAKAQFYFTVACSLSLAHSRAVSLALAEYGDHGPQISGVIRDHFPDDIKEHLRGLCRDICAASDAAYASRPHGVRMTTMRALSRAVAADGTGFYGPQP